jgi:ABC-type sugar transport system ATPase subunit
MVYGVLRPDEGEIRWEGQIAPPLDPRTARALGIGMVFQHFSLFEAMTVAENVALGLDHPGPMPALAARIEVVSQAYGLPLDPTREVHTLSVGERQRIEIVRCLLAEPRLLVMDEPTSVLTPNEVGTLFETLRRLAAEGCSILYISHKLEEIRALGEAATVLRAGRVVARCDPRREDAAGLARLMMGADNSRPGLGLGHRPANSDGGTGTWLRVVRAFAERAAADCGGRNTFERRLRLAQGTGHGAVATERSAWLAARPGSDCHDRCVDEGFSACPRRAFAPGSSFHCHPASDPG